MKFKTHLIYKSVNTCFHTKLPVYFYGMPNGKMVVLFTQNNGDFPFDTTIKWVLAEHSDFSYNFVSGHILTNGQQKVDIDEFMELADNLEQRIKIIATFGSFYSNSEALNYFNINADNMLISQKPVKLEMDFY
jgi:hypothetical protein